ncbi:MAG: hypothetical protein HKM96_15675 [Boseongicola sp.]|nr:hypothetical protein [Boseongicola sp.]NNL73815.1 hypothetical protein [Silicimonas sp.]
MSDVMQMARTRRQDLVDTIDELESEIAQMQGEIRQLDTFLQIGAGLIDGTGADMDAVEAVQTEADDIDGLEDEFEPDIRDESDLQTARSIRQIMPLHNSRADDADSDFDLYDDR